MKLKLSVWQRETIKMRVGGLRGGSLALMRKGFLILDAVCLTDAEKTQIGYVTSLDGSSWTSDLDADIEIGDHEAVNLLKRVVEEAVADTERKARWDMQAARGLTDLCDQLKIDLDEIVARVAEEKEKAKAKDEKEVASPSTRSRRRRKTKAESAADTPPPEEVD